MWRRYRSQTMPVAGPQLCSRHHSRGPKGLGNLRGEEKIRRAGLQSAGFWIPGSAAVPSVNEICDVTKAPLSAKGTTLPVIVV